MGAKSEGPGLLTVSRTMRAATPVFIVGEARSGTSILYRTLQKHPSFRPHIQNLVETEVFAHLWRTFMFNPTYPDSLRRFMLGDDQAYGDFLRVIRPLRVVSAVLAPVNYLLRDHVPSLWSVNLHHLVLRAYFFYAWRARGCHRLVEKTPTNTLHLPKLNRTFPRSRFIYIHRHPVDVFTSYRRRAAVDRDAGWADLELDEFCRIYAAGAQRALTWRQAGHDNLLLVAYEDLTSDPVRAFAEVCEFLGEPPAPAAVEEADPDPDRWQVDPHLWGEIVPRTKDWGDYLSSQDARVLQDRLADTMAALGYAPYTAG
jgi:hypothetical protein